MEKKGSQRDQDQESCRGYIFLKVLLYAREKNPLMDDVTSTARNEVTFTREKKNFKLSSELSLCSLGP